MQLSDKHMDQLSVESVENLISEHNGVCVSIYMPTHQRYTETQQDPIRLKNLLRNAEKQLAERGLRSGDVENLLAPARDLVDRTTFWQYQSKGLALFLSSGNLISYRLPLDFEEFVAPGKRFYVKPLLPLLKGDGRFHVLAVSQGGVRFLHGTRHTIEEVNLQNVPKSLADAMKFDEFDRSLQFHTGTQGRAGAGVDRAAVFHGQGAAADEDNVKQNILQFFQQLDKGVCEYLGDDHAPLVLAGVEFIRALYREANHYQHLVEEGIEGNPDNLSSKDLHQKAWQIIGPVFQRDRDQALERYKQLAGKVDPRAADSLEIIVPAAIDKRVQTLIEPIGKHYWGNFDPESRTIQLHEEGQPGDEDLLDLAVVHTLQNGGDVFAVEPEEMPNGASVAAILRY